VYTESARQNARGNPAPKVCRQKAFQERTDLFPVNPLQGNVPLKGPIRRIRPNHIAVRGRAAKLAHSSPEHSTRATLALRNGFRFADTLFQALRAAMAFTVKFLSSFNFLVCHAVLLYAVTLAPSGVHSCAAHTTPFPLHCKENLKRNGTPGA
jgi:hypothetical protein